MTKIYPNKCMHPNISKYMYASKYTQTCFQICISKYMYTSKYIQRWFQIYGTSLTRPAFHFPPAIYWHFLHRGWIQFLSPENLSFFFFCISVFPMFDILYFCISYVWHFPRRLEIQFSLSWNSESSLIRLTPPTEYEWPRKCIFSLLGGVR